MGQPVAEGQRCPDAVALTLRITTEPSSLLWNGIVCFMLSLSLVFSVVPVAGPLLYETAINVLLSALNPSIDLYFLSTVFEGGVLGAEYSVYAVALALRTSNQEISCAQDHKGLVILILCTLLPDVRLRQPPWRQRSNPRLPHDGLDNY